MAETYKVLGQLKPAAGALSGVYTVPGAATAIVSTICVCEQAGSATTFRISVAVGGSADTPAQYLAFDTPIEANEPLFFTLGIALAAGDVVRVSSASGSVSFNVFGVQN